MTQAPLKSQTSEAVVISGCCISQATAEQIPKLYTEISLREPEKCCSLISKVWNETEKD